jgi:hypothetical protein
VTESSPQLKQGLITTYGLFWRIEEAKEGNASDKLSLYGRRGHRKDLRVVDFTEQSGIYILFGNYGPHYVGLAVADSLGKRLRKHLTEKAHRKKWNRFCWFGFRRVVLKPDRKGVSHLDSSVRSADSMPGVKPKWAIRDIEALLIG